MRTPNALFTRAATTFAELSPALIAIREKHGRFTFVNAAWTQLLGWSTEELLSRPALDFTVADDRPRAEEAIHSHEAGVGPASFVTRFRHIDGSTRTLLWHAVFDPRTEAMYGVATDITQRIAVDERQAAKVAELARRSRQLTHLVELGRFVGGGAPLRRVITAAVRALANGLGTSHAALYLGPPNDLVFAAGYGYESVAAPGDRLVEDGISQVGRTIEACVPFASGPASLARTPLQERSGIEASLCVPILRTSGVGVLCADDVAPHAFDVDDVAFAEACAALIASVVSRESGTAIQAQRGRHDIVIPTRSAFERVLEARRMRDEILVVLAVEAPAELEAEVVLAAIDAALPGASVGCEETRRFLIAAPISDDDARTAAARLRAALDEPLAVTIGIARLPGDAADAAAAIDAAELAATIALREGRTGLAMYEPAMTAAAHLSRAIRADIRLAIANGEFFLVFQPIVNARRGTITAFEALVRWNHPQAGIIPPNDFIAIAEETGDSVALTRWVLHEAAKQCRTWQRFASDAVSVAVNVSAIDLADAMFLDSVTHALRSASLPAPCLTIEVTESVFMHDVEGAARTLAALRSFGATTALDDFGTGYSSLAYLRRLPFDALKIDQSFVREIATDDHDRVLADAIVAVAKKFGMLVTAEGVETAEQAQILRALGCDSLQGFHFARPVAAGAVEALFRSPSLPVGYEGAEENPREGHYRAS